MLLRHKELTYSALTIKLLITQILEAITKDDQFDRSIMPKQTNGIISQLTQIVKTMDRLGDQTYSQAYTLNNSPINTKQMFKDCLKIFSTSLNLLSQDSIREFMQ
jgi:hypothetical protein